jgi:hypothetical protein
MEIVIASVIVAIIVLLDVMATRAILRDELSEQTQKTAQLAIVWLMPLIGALIVLGVHRSAETPSRKYREQPDAPDEFVFPGRGPRASSHGDADSD